MFAGRFSSSIGLVGVDLGSRRVKLLQIREQNRKLSVVGVASVDMTLDDPVAIDQATLTRQLRAAITSGGFTGRRCVVSLPRHCVQIQAIRLPRMPEADMRQAALWEASQRFGYDRDTVVADFLRTGASLQSSENREELILIAASAASLQAHLEPVLAAGLRPVAVDTYFGALGRIYSRHCRRESDQSQVRAVVEVGMSGATVMILRGDQIAFCKTVAIGGAQFNQAVVEHLQLDERAAIELRAARLAASEMQGAAQPTVDPATDRAVFEAVRSLLGDLVKEVVLCLRYYGVTFRGHPPDQIVLSGGDALEPKLKDMLGQACKLPVVLDDPMNTMSSLIVEIRQKLNRTPGAAVAWAVAAGLSARGLAESKRAAAEEEPQAESRRGAA